jgi:hypothetical protein
MFFPVIKVILKSILRHYKKLSCLKFLFTVKGGARATVGVITSILESNRILEIIFFE